MLCNRFRCENQQNFCRDVTVTNRKLNESIIIFYYLKSLPTVKLFT